ncbi:c-type cytochrome [Paracoccus sp. SJTW-4]|uniref:c-type cytochrome n=1 Tax=Paracoccus sp. SJTW-4 TaxID=3078428 RepID=UPI0039E8E704
MRISLYATLATLALAVPAVAQDGDAEKGQKEFNKCKACHMVQAPDGTDIVKGGKTGPNLYGIVGSKPAAEEGFKYGEGILELAEKNPDMVWDEASLIEYMTDPGAYLKAHTGDDKAKTKMTFKLNKNQADVAAFLAAHSPEAGEAAAGGDEG